MSKIKVTYKLNTKDNNIFRETKGIKNKNNIVFNDDKMLFKVATFENNIVINRSNDEYELILNLSLNKSEAFFITKEQGTFKIDIRTINLLINDNNIKVKYELDNEIFEFEIKYEVIE